MRSILASCSFLSAMLATACVSAAEIEAPQLFAKLDANADGELAPKEIASDHRLLFARLLRTGDADGDGRLTAEEFAAGLQPVRAEKAPVEKQGSRLPGADALVVVLAKMDANGDGQIEADEVPEEYQTLFERMLGPGDDDKDGVLKAREIARAAPRFAPLARFALVRMGLDVEEELEKLPASQRESMEEMDAYPRPEELFADPEATQELFKRLDANGDRQLSADEATGPFADRFQQMLKRGDRDGDKQLSNREFTTLARRIAIFQKGRMQPDSQTSMNEDDSDSSMSDDSTKRLKKKAKKKRGNK